jgi:hypothetical protein
MVLINWSKIEILHKENTDALLVMFKEVRLEANVERSGILQDRITARG